MADMNSPTLSLKSLNIDETGDSGSHVHLSGVVPGIINSVLRVIGISGSTDLRMNASYLEVRTGNAKGQSSWFVPTGSLSSIQGGYKKDFVLLIIALFTFILALVADIGLAMEGGGSFGFGVFTGIGAFFAIVIILIYVFTKTMYFEIESGGGMTARIQFQGAIDLDEVERALLIMQALIAKAQYDGLVVVMGKLAAMAIPEKQLAVQQQEVVAPQILNTSPQIEQEEIPSETSPPQSDSTKDKIEISTTHVDDEGNEHNWDGANWVKVQD